MAGMMEFRRPDEPLDQRRIGAIVDATRELLPGGDLDHRRDEWVGSRPCTTNGEPSDFVEIRAQGILLRRLSLQPV